MEGMYERVIHTTIWEPVHDAICMCTRYLCVQIKDTNTEKKIRKNGKIARSGKNEKNERYREKPNIIYGLSS